MIRDFLITRGFKKREPWISKFRIRGREYGGDYDPAEDCRLHWFDEQFPDVRTVLDLGSLEGAQSLYLAGRPGVQSVVGLEGRSDNIEKARYCAKLLKASKVEFHQLDLEHESLDRFGSFDVVFCAGVLYHLLEPWHLIERMSRISKNAFIWTHYASDEQATKTINGYNCFEYQELGLADPQSGLSPISRWLRFDCLLDMIRQNGFPSVQVIEKNPETRHGPVTTLVARAD